VAVYDTAIYARSPVFAQSLALSAQGAVQRVLRRGPRFSLYLRELEASQWLCRDALVAVQNERLAHLIRHCYEKVPYYRRVMEERGLVPADVECVDDLEKLPLLTKEIVRTEGANLLRSDLPRFGVFRSKTSGTTGKPLQLVRDLISINKEYAFIWRVWRAAGMRLSDSRASYRGDFIVPPRETRPPYWRHSWPDRLLYLSMLHLSPETAPLYFDTLRRARPRALEAFPTGAEYLARLALEQEAGVHFDFVLTSSEPVPEALRELVAGAFSCEIYDYYGQAERVVFAWECPAHEGLHLAPEYGVTEFVEPEDEAPDGLHEIVGTSFINYAMPLVRYRTGDLGRQLPGDCPCGRSAPRIAPIETRVGADAVLPDGRLISYLALTRVFGLVKHIRKSQVVQDRRDHFLVKIVPGPDFTDDDAAEVVERVAGLLGQGVSVETSIVDDVPREKSGKLRWFVSELED
jgi:phenylacetate-CoA ligase